ncbi:hypothetical protein [Ruminococcus sp. HUN007]|uniref:hypothetical protein n=1 Tax=Ruminococcus sp. HUN007 TaxID=1514668 RepID=UPI0005D23D94|nr:hypothetical protein [Ruminococcus sp. HUN007]
MKTKILKGLLGTSLVLVMLNAAVFLPKIKAAIHGYADDQHYAYFLYGFDGSTPYVGLRNTTSSSKYGLVRIEGYTASGQYIDCTGADKVLASNEIVEKSGSISGASKYRFFGVLYSTNVPYGSPLVEFDTGYMWN